MRLTDVAPLVGYVEQPLQPRRRSPTAADYGKNRRNLTALGRLSRPDSLRPRARGQGLSPSGSSGYTGGMNVTPLTSGGLRVVASSATGHALRGAVAASLCLVLAEVWRLEHAN